MKPLQILNEQITILKWLIIVKCQKLLAQFILLICLDGEVVTTVVNKMNWCFSLVTFITLWKLHMNLWSIEIHKIRYILLKQNGHYLNHEFQGSRSSLDRVVEFG